MVATGTEERASLARAPPNVRIRRDVSTTDWNHGRVLPLQWLQVALRVPLRPIFL